MNSLVCHTYPLSAFIRHLSNPFTVTFDSNAETETEFDDYHDMLTTCRENLRFNNIVH
jgi:hypothetical protein